MTSILVAYATNSGTTEEVAKAVAEELGKKGAQTSVRLVSEINSLEGYDAVVIGAPMIMGWHREAVKFVKKHAQELSRVPSAYFIMAMSLTQSGEESVQGTPLVIDPRLAKPPKNPGRPGLKERYAMPVKYVRPILQAAPQAKPVGVAIFGGRLDLFRLSLWHRLFVMLVIGAQPGEFRNWTFIREWAAGLKDLTGLKDL
jgi:menaquinone-dependent protoporphyrinogen oxidase